MRDFEPPELSSLVAVTFHLMSCYTLRPCPRLAGKVAEHLEVLLNAHGEAFGPWQGAFVKMRNYWLQLAFGGRNRPGLKSGEENLH